MSWDALYEWLRALWFVWFMILFIGIVAYVYWPGRKGHFEARGRIPFRADGE